MPYSTLSAQIRFGGGLGLWSQGSGGSGMSGFWCRPGVRFKEGSGGLVQARCKVQGGFGWSGAGQVKEGSGGSGWSGARQV